MKKALVIILALCLVFSLCACGSKAEVSTVQKEQASTQPEYKAAGMKPAEEEEKAEEAKITQEKEEPEEAENSENLDDQIRPEIKEAIDSYEAFVDEYCSFMTEYTITDLSKLSTYNELLKKEVEMGERFEALDKEELTTAESLYYSEVSLRCSQKMLDVASKMLE